MSNLKHRLLWPLYFVGFVALVVLIVGAVLSADYTKHRPKPQWGPQGELLQQSAVQPAWRLSHNRASLINHIPEPDWYTLGRADKNYCGNLTDWYVTLHLRVASGMDRIKIQKLFKPHLAYEVAHDWLTQDDMNMLLAYTASVPNTSVPPTMGAMIYDYCINRDSPEPLAAPKVPREGEIEV